MSKPWSNYKNIPGHARDAPHPMCTSCSSPATITGNTELVPAHTRPKQCHRITFSSFPVLFISAPVLFISAHTRSTGLYHTMWSPMKASKRRSIAFIRRIEFHRHRQPTLPPHPTPTLLSLFRSSGEQPTPTLTEWYPFTISSKKISKQ